MRKRSSASKIKAALVSWGQKLGIFQGERSFNGVTPEQDAAYAEAVKRGDLETARRMEREVYERMGYSDDSSYQGTSAFNGAAPSRNAYFETKAERIEAAKNGEMEDTTTLGDYRDGIDVNNLQFIVFDPRSERNADAKRQEAIRNIRGVLDSGAKTIKMYRSVPADVKEGQFRNGDWITPSRAYAGENARIHGWKESRIIEQEVSIEDVWWDGNDIAEWGFDDGKGSVYKNTLANRKLLGPTYDDAGNLIPLSKRFNDWNNNAKFAASVGSLTGGKKNGRLSDVDQKRLTAVMRGLETGELKHPRFTTEEFAASKGTEHEQLWNYILSLESPDLDGGGAQAVAGGERKAHSQGSERLGRLRRVATRYGRDPKEIAAADHKYFDRGAESRVYDKGDGTVIKVRRLDAYDMDGVKHALAKIVYHNYLFPKDAYRLQDIAVWKNGSGRDEFYMILEQPMVTPKRDANGNIIEPSQGAIFEALEKTGQKFNITGGYYDNGDTRSGSSSSDVVESAKMVAANGDYAVYDFKPGRNTFIDAETGEVRFIDPRIDINDPTDNFAYSKFGKRRRTDAWFDIEAQTETARRQAEARKNASEGEWTAEDESRLREQEEAAAALEDENFDGSPSGNGEGKFAAGGQVVGDYIIGPDGTVARRGTTQAAMIGGARVADDAGYGERTPGSMRARLRRCSLRWMTTDSPNSRSWTAKGRQWATKA